MNSKKYFSPDELSKLPDGEINRMVAERLGWTRVSERTGCGWWGFVPDGSHSRQLPDWCTDLNAAWDLVEKQFPEASVLLLKDKSGTTAILGLEIHASKCKTTAPHPARAIAVAVLLAMGEK